MSAPRAADLPVGSVVAAASTVWIRTENGPLAWASIGRAARFGDRSIDQEISHGAQVLRVGDGSDR